VGDWAISRPRDKSHEHQRCYVLFVSTNWPFSWPVTTGNKAFPSFLPMTPVKSPSLIVSETPRHSGTLTIRKLRQSLSIQKSERSSTVKRPPQNRYSQGGKQSGDSPQGFPGLLLFLDRALATPTNDTPTPPLGYGDLSPLSLSPVLVRRRSPDLRRNGTRTIPPKKVCGFPRSRQ
jgi:hypothetical protein